MIFAILSLITAVIGFVLVGVCASGEGYGAIGIVVFGCLFVSATAALLAAISFIRKETRSLSVLALLVALAPFFFLAAKFAEDLYDSF